MRRHRLAAGLSQEAVAERVEVDRAHVSSMERGQQNITLTTLSEAAKALGVRPAAFFDEAAPPAPAGVKAAADPARRLATWMSLAPKPETARR
jgi:transcriptional regulator with XRE-family HTH domain